MKIAADIARQLLETNLENIVAKLKAGGTLTKAEKADLEKQAASTPPPPVPTASASAPAHPAAQAPAPAPSAPSASPPPEPAGPVGPASIARYWTAHGYPCSRQYASRCITKLSCPTDSLAASLQWRQARGAPRAPSLSATPPPAAPSAPDIPAPPPAISPIAEIMGDSLDAILARARQAERECYRSYLLAAATNDPGAISVALRNHKDAQKNLIEVEAMLFTEKIKRGEYVSLPEAQKRISDRLSPLRAARSQLSRVLALALFPEAPHRAQPRIDAELSRIWDPAVTTATVPLVDPAHAVAAAPAAAPAAA